MSDIFKKMEERKKEAKAAQPSTAEAAPSLPETPPSIDHFPLETTITPAEKKVEPEVSPFAEIRRENKEAEAGSLAECERAYQDALLLIEEIMKKDALYELIDIHRLNSIIEKLVELTIKYPAKMTELALNPDLPSQSTYIFCHVVNVCVLAILIGLELGYDQSRLKELGEAALLHDVGMSHYLDIIGRSEALSKEDFEKVKRHSLIAKGILSNMKGINDVSFLVAQQHHERMDGSGYPDGLKGDQIHEYSSIVGMLDMYEAMMHRRTYRTAFQSRETIQEILKNKSAYDPKMIKVLINKIGIFPIGSLVELNTKELARVVSLNPSNILRPIVKIITNANGEECTEEKQVNLASEPAIWIKHFDNA